MRDNAHEANAEQALITGDRVKDVRKDSHRLVEDGRVKFGRFETPLDDVNLDDAQPWPPWVVPRWLRRLRLKEWQAFQITHPRFFIIVALFDAKFVSLVQMKLYDRQSGKKYQLEKQLLPGSFRTPRTLKNSVCMWRKKDEWVRFENHLDEGFIAIDVRIGATQDAPAVNARLHADASTTMPLIVSIPFGQNRGMYSHKALLPVTGMVRIGDERISVQPETASLMTDDHKGYYGRLMRWDWLVGAAWRDGSLQGFNLTHNASIDPERYHENGFWIDGVLHRLPPVSFTREEGLWTVRDQKGHVDLRFKVEVEGTLFQNYGLIESRYLGPFGTFEGTLRSLQGIELNIDEMFGMGERFWLKA